MEALHLLCVPFNTMEHAVGGQVMRSAASLWWEVQSLCTRMSATKVCASENNVSAVM